jgi:ketosteroid isomerase-like protein
VGGRPKTRREEAEAIVRAINQRDFESPVWERLDPEFEFHSALSAAEGHFHVGVEGMRDWAQATDEVWGDFRIAIIDFQELDEERVFILYRATGRARGSGVPLDPQTAQIVTYRDGRMWRNASYTDIHKARAEAGLVG